MVSENNSKKPEILAPAGDFEKLQVAVAYGADAVYVGGKQFNLRANTKNFDSSELERAIDYAHAYNVKVYVAANIFAHNADIEGLHDYLQNLKDIGADAVIVADLGVFDIARKIEGLEIHISTQANITNHQSAQLYKSLGAKRVILARELSFEEIRKVNDKVSDDNFQTEAFAHGAMCVSYSGRCLLSSYMTGRDSNKGDCAQPCRWKYHLMEQERPGEYLPVYENERGTYIMNSKDLCLVGHIPELVASGVASLKIEGRMKSAYYVAVTTSIYREALDDYFTSPVLYASKRNYYLEELQKTSHRDFFTGFFLDENGMGQTYPTNTYTSTHEFLGLVIDYDPSSRYAIVEQRNKFSVGDEVEFMCCSRPPTNTKSGFTQVITDMYNGKGQPVSSAPHAQEQIRVKVDRPVTKFDIMRGKAR
ncbi:MAG: U32 family peptidase [Firmicutes bacterium]|nr:U32 family peptidase [Bacillota bacterium]